MPDIEKKPAREAIAPPPPPEEAKPPPGPSKPSGEYTWVTTTKEGEEWIAWKMDSKGKIERIEQNHAAIHIVERAKLDLQKNFPESFR